MEQKKPMELGLQLLKDINIVRHNEFRFINAEFGFVTSFSKMETTIFSVGQPYRLQEGRIAIVTNGSARVLINLIEYIFLPDHISLIAPNSIIQIIEVSHDFDAHMMAIDLNFLPDIRKGRILHPFPPTKEKSPVSTVYRRTNTDREFCDGHVECIARTSIQKRGHSAFTGRITI